MTNVSLSVLAARPGASSVQDRRPGIQSLARNGASVLWTTQARLFRVYCGQDMNGMSREALNLVDVIDSA